MTRSEYLRLMHFAPEWEEWGLISNEWLEGAMSTYEQGMENASEHDRNGQFHWRIKRDPSMEELVLLSKLSWLEPDHQMAEGWRDYIRQANNYSPEVESALAKPANWRTPK